MVIRLLTLVATLALLAGCESSQRWVYHQGMDFEKWRAGLEERTVDTDDGLRWHVLQSADNAEAPAVLLIHGFGADSRNWVRFANELEGDYRFVIPDLPGHGDTEPRTTDMEYGISEQARRLFRLLDAMQLEQVHVAGNSMGGAIAIEMARHQPQRLRSLGLVDSAGITLQTPKFLNALEQSDSNPLIPHTAEEFHTTLEWASERSVGIPDFAITLMGEEKAANADVAEKVWQDINLDPAMRLQGRDVLPRIKTPALILWGREDALLSVENVRVFQKELPNNRAVILEGVGHVPMAEAPEETAEAFRSFWKDIDG